MNRRILAFLLACLIAAPIPASAGQIYVPATIESLTVAGQTIGDLIYADSTSSFTRLADVATGNALISGGVGAAPSWGKIGLTTHVSGTLAYGSGGTGATSYTTNRILKAGAAAFADSLIADDGTDLTLAATSTKVKLGTGSTYFSGGANNGQMYVCHSDGTCLFLWMPTGQAGRIGGTSLKTINFSSTGIDTQTDGDDQAQLGKANVGWRGLWLASTVTGTVGAVTISKPSGRAIIAAAATSVVVTNTRATANAKCLANLQANDATALYVRSCVTSAGSLTITVSAAATANLPVDFVLINAD